MPYTLVEYQEVKEVCRNRFCQASLPGATSGILACPPVSFVVIIGDHQWVVLNVSALLDLVASV
jgi:hypothetical protein